MQETVMFAIIIIVVALLGTLVYSGYFQNSLYSSFGTLSAETYGYLSQIINLTGSNNFECTGQLPTFTVTPQEIIEMNSFLAYKNAQQFTGGIPSKGIIYYEGSQMFIVSPYPISSGTYSNSKICIIPSNITSPVLIVEPTTS